MPARESLTVIVERGPAGEVLGVVEGAPVALDVPGGGRLEGTTNAAGRVVFDGLDWSRGTADVTAYLEGAGLTSYLGIERTTELRIPFEVQARPRSPVTVSGTFRNIEPGFTVLTVSALGAPGFMFVRGGTAYSMQVAAGEPLTLVAAQVRYEPLGLGARNAALWWTVVQHPALDADTVIDLDLSVHAETERVTGSITLPPDGYGTTANWQINVYSLASAGGDPAGVVGWASRVTLPPGLIDYEVEFLRLLPEDQVSYSIGAYDGYGPASWVSQPGYPRPGMQDVEPPAIQTIVTPMPGEGVGLHDVIRWRGRANDLSVVRRAGPILGSGIVWEVVVPEGTTEAVIPAAPSGVDVDAVVGTEPLEAQIALHEDLASGWSRLSASRLFEVLP